MNGAINLKSIESFLSKKYIHLNQIWIQQKLEVFNKINSNPSTFENSIYNEFLKSNINESVDKQKVINLKEKINKEKPHELIQGYFLFQIEEYVNIAEPQYKINKNFNNLDVVEDSEIETKYLQNEDDKSKKVFEKKIFKIKLNQGLSDNREVYIYGFEYKPIKNIENYLDIKNQKVIVGPSFESRRGFIYLTNENIKFL